MSISFTDDDGDVVDMELPEVSVLQTNSEVIGYLAEAMKKKPEHELILGQIKAHSDFILKLSGEMTKKPSAEIKAIKKS